ncbi:MAG: hypothetical protein HFI48_05755 [Lachnospiraceae bacterium]|nr:hypothetical protein [Lachnospiraceae bacterium]
MDLEKILKSQGYTDEQIQAIMSAMKENSIYTSDVENPGEEIRKLQDENDRLKTEKEKKPEKVKETDPALNEMVKQMREEVKKTKLAAVAMISLTKAGAKDVDYLMYKAENDGELQKLNVGEDGKINGVDEMVSGLQKNYAAYFVDADKDKETLVRAQVKKLEVGQMPDEEPQTLEEAIAQKYSGEE